MLQNFWIYMNERVATIMNTMTENTTTQNPQNMPARHNWCCSVLATVLLQAKFDWNFFF